MTNNAYKRNSRGCANTEGGLLLEAITHLYILLLFLGTDIMICLYRLCCPPNSAKKLLGEPFVLRQAVPVDLFPHTPHCELVLLFTR
jgi:hypothetical protein